jgi:putative FmdB family regulatory protein
MPFYEYECQSCKFYTEVLQKITDEPLKKCPSCGKNQLKKLVSAPVFRLKGAGWYETDFKSDKENKRNLAVEKEAESASSDAGKSSDTTAADSKPAAAPAAAKPESKETGSAAAESGSRRSKAASSRSSVSKPAPPASRGRSAAKARPVAKPKSKAKPAARKRR